MATIDPTLIATANLSLFAVLLLAFTPRLSGRPGPVTAITVLGAVATGVYGLLYAGPAAFPIASVAAVLLLSALLLPRVEPCLQDQHVEVGALLLLAGAGTVALATSSNL